MKNLKKFNTKSMIKFIKNECDKLSTNELCKMQAGLAKFFSIYSKYDKDIYGASKRINDLFQYASIVSSITIDRIKKEEQNNLNY